MNHSPEQVGSALSVAIVGAGPAGLMAAEVLSRTAGVEVTVYERMPSVGRKLLMAGRGGLNLTHSEPFDTFLSRYGPRAPLFLPFLEAFSPDDLRRWAEGLEQPTFVGSSGRVFPSAMKASGLLRAWLRRLHGDGVRFLTRHRWIGWDEHGSLRFSTPAGERTVQADVTILALGGASWPRLGSDGAWFHLLARAGIAVAPLQPANCGFHVPWSGQFIARFEGSPVNRIALVHGARRVRGEMVITRQGVEGGVVYALSSSVRQSLMADGGSKLVVDLKPDVDHSALADQLRRPRGKASLSTFLRKAGRLSPPAIGLLQEAAHWHARPLAGLDAEELARAIKAVVLPVVAIGGMERAISTAGGIPFEELTDGLMLRRLPGVFVAGEMLDWEAPTGGYLLQGCFATGFAAGLGARAWLNESRATSAPPA